MPDVSPAIISKRDYSDSDRNDTQRVAQRLRRDVAPKYWSSEKVLRTCRPFRPVLGEPFDVIDVIFSELFTARFSKRSSETSPQYFCFQEANTGEDKSWYGGFSKPNYRLSASSASKSFGCKLENKLQPRKHKHTLIKFLRPQPDSIITMNVSGKNSRQTQYHFGGLSR